MALLLIALDLDALAVQKVLLAARVAGVTVATKSGAPAGIDRRSVSCPPCPTSSWSLRDDHVCLTTVRSALLYLGRITQTSNLVGSTLWEEGLVDSWLSTIHYYVDWPLTVALTINEDATSTTALANVLAQLNSHFSKQSCYLVGDHVTVADVSLAISLQRAEQAGLYQPCSSDTVHLHAWYQRIQQTPWWKDSNVSNR